MQAAGRAANLLPSRDFGRTVRSSREVGTLAPATSPAGACYVQVAAHSPTHTSQIAVWGQQDVSGGVPRPTEPPFTDSPIAEAYGRWTKPLGGGRYAWGSPRLIFFRTKDLAEATEKAYDQEHRCISARNSGDAAPAKVPWVPNWHSNPIADRVRRKHQRLTPTHVIETASAPPFQLFSCSYRLGSSEQR